MKFWDFLLGRRPTEAEIQIIMEMERTQKDFKVREVAFWSCVSMLANAIGRAEIKTYREGEEIREREYYLWNIEPNVNESATAFWHHLVARMCVGNEALAVSIRKREGYDAIAVADAWNAGKLWPARQREYTGVHVGDLTYDKTFREDEVLHLRWNEKAIKGVLDQMYDSYCAMMEAENAAVAYARGKHIKVHVDQTATGDKDWEKRFKERIEEQLKPFLASDSAVLPEFSGYTYTDFTPKNAENADADAARKLAEDIFDNTARAFLIPAVLLKGDVAGAENAKQRFYTDAVDPIAQQIEQEINRKRYTYEDWERGTRVHVDTSALEHYDVFGGAADLVRLVGSGVYSPNEVRRVIRRPPIGESWADEYHMTLNIGGVSAAGNNGGQ